MSRAFAVALGSLALAVALVFTAPPAAHAQVTTDIEGHVVNGTAGSDAPFGLTVTLNVFRLGDLQETRDTVAGEDGGFAFRDVPGGEGHGYILSADYGGIVYTYERDYPLPEEPVSLMVYESTDSRDSISVSSHSLVVGGVDPDNQTIEMLELVGLENTGDRSFLADLSQAQVGQMAFLRFSLPQAVTDLDVQSSMRGGTILQVDRGFAMTTPVKPGEHEIAYSFRTTYSAGRLTFDHGLPFGAADFRVLLPEGLGRVSSDGLQEMEPLTLGDRTYQRLDGQDLPAGERVVLKFTDLPQPSLWARARTTATDDSFIVVSIPIALGAWLLALLGYVLLRSRRPAEAAASPADRASAISAIAALDDRFSEGDMVRQEYLRERWELKDRLLTSTESSALEREQPRH
ncbi:MAG: hypothetical protein OXP10_01620 [Chloroflexota bacterium]|nr:hypothetical protein [Chloroflexota bacterium]